MPVIKCSNKKYRIGSGQCMYKTKDSAERAYKGYQAHKHMNEEQNELVTEISGWIESGITDPKEIAKKLNNTNIELITKLVNKIINKDFMVENMDKVDTITVDVPLFLRLLEWAKEDSKNDMDLHDITENIVRLNKTNNVLNMSNYDEIINKDEDVNEILQYNEKLSKR